MTQAQLLDEFKQLPLAQQIDLLRSALEIISAEVRLSAQRDDKSRSKLSLEEAALLLRSDYETDEELTSFTALDGEPFYA